VVGILEPMDAHSLEGGMKGGIDHADEYLKAWLEGILILNMQKIIETVEEVVVVVVGNNDCEYHVDKMMMEEGTMILERTLKELMTNETT
jgi:hypothetical protein